MAAIRLFERFSKDLAYGARILWRSPGFTAVAAISLGLGIGANAAIFSLIDGLWTRAAGSAAARSGRARFLCH